MRTVVDAARIRETTSAGLYPLRAVDRVCDVLEALAESSSGASLSAISASTNLPKSSAYRYLAALETRGWVSRDEDGLTYQLHSPARLRRPSQFERVQRLAMAARPLLRRLRGTSALTACMTTLDGADVHVVAIDAGPTIRTVVGTGDRLPFYATASGKALAAQLADQTVAELLDNGMEPRTATTVVSPAAFLRELHRVRGDGFALSDREAIEGVRGIAVAVPGHPAALGLLGSPEEITGEHVPSLVRLLRRVAVVLARSVPF